MKLFTWPLLLLAAAPFSASLFKPINNYPLTSLTAPGLRVNQVHLFQVLPYESKPGKPITLNGSGFSKQSNTVFIGNVAVNATSTSGTSMNIVLPPTLLYGTYDVFVTNSLGSSKNAKTKISIKITDSPAEAPRIIKTSVNKEEVTVSGVGFAPTNTIITSLGSIINVRSDGKSLNFKLTDLALYQKIKLAGGGRSSIFLSIFVQNEHGLSVMPYNINITL